MIEGAGITKRFGGVTALEDASFAAERGEVHALVGENGAGKSTTIKILSGVLRPDSGTLRIGGDAVRLRSPEDALGRGVATVFQELTLLPGMTVASTDRRGLPPMQVEGAAFAWLAMRHVRGLPGNLPAATGGTGLRVLGSYTPA